MNQNKKEINMNILKIVLPVIITILIQTGSLVWWASSVEQRLDVLEAETVDRYYGKDAQARAVFVDHRFNKLEESITIIASDMKNSVKRIEDKLDKYIFSK